MSNSFKNYLTMVNLLNIVHKIILKGTEFIKKAELK